MIKDNKHSVHVKNCKQISNVCYNETVNKPTG